MKTEPTCHGPHQELFNHMLNEHNVTLLTSDLYEIIDIVGWIEQGEEKVTADHLYKDWLIGTERSDLVLTRSAIKDFIQYLDSHFIITKKP